MSRHWARQGKAFDKCPLRAGRPVFSCSCIQTMLLPCSEWLQTRIRPATPNHRPFDLSFRRGGRASVLSNCSAKRNSIHQINTQVCRSYQGRRVAEFPIVPILSFSYPPQLNSGKFKLLLPAAVGRGQQAGFNTSIIFDPCVSVSLPVWTLDNSRQDSSAKFAS